MKELLFLKKKDKDFIENHLQNLSITITILDEGLQKNKWNKHESAGMGVYLSNVYNGYENILRALINSRGIEIPRGERWHKDLLDIAESERLVPDEMLTTLKGMLGFRHLQIHGYSYMFDEEQLKYYSSEAIKSHSIFEIHIQQIIKKSIEINEVNAEEMEL